MDEHENLKLSVTNFGPIAKAAIDLRPLTVFVGPSNTGKSYLAILIYALHKFFGVHSIGPWIGYRYWNRDLFDTEQKFNNLIDSSINNETISNWIKKHLTSERAADSLDSYIDLPEPVANLVRNFLRTLSRSADSLNNGIAREFGFKDTRNLIRNHVNSGAKVCITRPSWSDKSKSQDSYFSYEFIIKKLQSEIRASIPDTIQLKISEHSRVQLYNEVNEIARFMIREGDDKEAQRNRHALIMGGLAEGINSLITEPLTSAAYYLPADRTGIMHAHRVVVGSIVAQAPRAGLQQDRLIPQLSGILADFLSQLIGLDSRLIRHPNRDTSPDLAALMETRILEGEILEGESSDAGYPEFFYRPLEWKHGDLSLMNASSMVSELAPIVLYLRHVVQPNEVLIIEEPESHLHPKMQVELTRHLAAAVKAGVRIIITTHSEWVLDELANLIYLSELPKPRRNGIAGADQALEPEEVGAWLFEPKSRPKGSVVKEIKFDEDYAGFRSGFDAVAIGTHNSYAEISDRLESEPSRRTASR